MPCPLAPLGIDINSVKGFLSANEGEALYRAAAQASTVGPVLEVGSYCGKSTLYLAAACKAHNNLVYAVDHHRGSEEHQPGELFHDPSLFDSDAQQVDSFKHFRRNLQTAGLSDYTVAIVASSSLAAQRWQTPLGMLFIDGGHSLKGALEDYRSWVCHLRRGGLLAIHDLFEHAEEGGQAPIAIYRLALASGLFEAVDRCDSLGILRRL
ncbi:class I SAM-dependent methyltransferase [Spongiibacter taiwanensis]|uniref:class I SAM-dependent methyltransferase n=1 Tax=Spongiibacter taiwanensis TaxID=1748242 RepID=UPI0020351F44|nr:class I SAM-dependent methyltransferase [Spongiibacter taiwanensis]USA44781.1 class I SAM-dependent methyltransferase [Spongiibacter taiwanensis]